MTIIEGASAARIAGWLDNCLSEANSRAEDRFAVTMPGGSTPFPILEALTAMDPGPPWSCMQIWPSDDRIVPDVHEASNIGKIRALIRFTGARVVPLTPDSDPPHFALTWLGMGADGHVASLFPSADPALDDPRQARRLTPDPLPPEAPFDRVTLTLPALLDTDAILFTLGGSADKRAVFEGAMRGENDLPVARLLKGAEARGLPVTCFA